MYLISIYFDEKTNKTIQGYINQVAEKTGNLFMVDGNVPPHITVSAFETKQEMIVLEKMEGIVRKMSPDLLQWVSVGTFLPYVLYITPVLNEYLHEMSELIYEEISSIKETKISPYYRPFSWLPHTTIGKKLTKEELRIGFEVLQNSFQVFQGKVVRIGVATTNPYQEIMSWDLS